MANHLAKLPGQTGVYLFRGKEGILYIGKAANIRNRVKNHFQQPTFRDTLFINQVTGIGYRVTSSEIEALLLEAKLIKKYRPKYNVMWRDDKNYFYVVLTKERFPRLFITHQIKNLKSKIFNLKSNRIGPFVDGRALKRALRYLRRIFPYYTQKTPRHSSGRAHPLLPCPWCHLDLCPGPHPDPKQYRKNIRAIKNILFGKSSAVLKRLKKEMAVYSKRGEYEKAANVRDQILALESTMENGKILSWENQRWENPQDRNLTFQAYTYFVRQQRENMAGELKKLLNIRGRVSRIEAYDISNIQGQQATGSMVVFVNGKPEKNSYRKFKIRISGKPNDTAMIAETITRRLSHPEWQLPDIMLIDGGKAQLNAALSAKKHADILGTKIVALAKRRNELFVEGGKKPILLKNCPLDAANLLLRLRDEAHRFSRAYHHYLRSKTIEN